MVHESKARGKWLGRQGRMVSGEGEVSEMMSEDMEDFSVGEVLFLASRLPPRQRTAPAGSDARSAVLYCPLLR